MDEGRDAGSFGPGQTLDRRAIGADRHDLGTERQVGGRVDQGLEQRAGARNEYYQAGRSPQARCSEGLGHDGQPSCV